MVENFIPSVLSRYRQQILFPVLRLFLALLMTLGTDNQYAVNQVDALLLLLLLLLLLVVVVVVVVKMKGFR